ncbi:Asp-tRNA(Asn)/Glu-tRNA(Gln) amidotransferase subunit GatB [Vampirovibrio chlorellavorus]|uniref:Asp-tRNA(Asn)/Glu-tRNA(Gln) amidotransferase subunit GatB n=1 Tax=Vampirovibrio chlorellavorus TaxID=758823 RepID=UPI0026F31840|nr:Asp-tRNA(Asn)/Glu-tRNA(Gln) amidotransferase subunit GatB [Vampirovibrio chlorellavorus]
MVTQAPVQYETVIGLEVHVQLKTDSKLFDPSPNAFGDEPNVNINTPCLGLPGALPVLNERAVEYAIRLGLALNCQIAEVTKFDRKQYFYPDLPKGYQISQYDYPICEHGSITLSNGRHVRILRAHLEEDAGKLVHAGAVGLAGSDYSLVDLNRAGSPLVEIVSEPDIRSAEEAREYMQQIRNIVRYLDVCDGNLEEGSMRCDANVSIRPVGSTEYGTKTEIKNMNSFRSVQRAIESEVARQIEIVEAGGKITQESRLWDEATQSTKTMRSKEEAHDYRYFPDPDLRPLAIPREQVEHLRQTLPELPHQRYDRLITGFGLSEYDAGVMVEFKEMGDFFELAVEHTDNYKAVSNWIQGDITAYLKNNKVSIFETKLSPKALAELVHLVDKNTISSAMAKKLLPELLEHGGEPEKLVQEKGMAQISDAGALRELIQKVIDANPANVEAYRGGKDKLFGFFVGQVMKESKGSANPELVNQLLKEMLA